MAFLLSLLCVIAYTGGLALAAGWDLATRSIPNILVGAIAAAAIGLLLLSAPLSLLSHGGVALGVLVGGAILFALRLWGAGDAKLLAAAAILLGTKGLPLLILGTAMGGGILAVVYLGLRYLPGQRMQTATGLPYGVAIACGAILACLGTNALGPLSGL